MSTPIPPQYGHVGAFVNNNGERNELDLVDCRSVLTDREIFNSVTYFLGGVSVDLITCADPNNA